MTTLEGPNSMGLIAPLDARVATLEETFHIPPPLAAAIVCHAEVTHLCAGNAAREGDAKQVKIITTAYVGMWTNIGAAFDMCAQPLGLGQQRIYAAARYTLTRTIKETQEMHDKIMNDPEFAKAYAKMVAGAEMERVLAKVSQPR